MDSTIRINDGSIYPVNEVFDKRVPEGDPYRLYIFRPDPNF